MSAIYHAVKAFLGNRRGWTVTFDQPADANPNDFGVTTYDDAKSPEDARFWFGQDFPEYEPLEVMPSLDWGLRVQHEILDQIAEEIRAESKTKESNEQPD